MPLTSRALGVLLIGLGPLTDDLVPRTYAQSRATVARDTLALDATSRLRQASNVVLAPTGTHVAYVLGDSLLIAPTRPDGGAPRVVATGVRGEASAPVPFLAWAPVGDRLLFRGGGVHDGVPMLAYVDGRPAQPLLADSIARTLATFQNLLAGGPEWSPDGRRVAFLAYRRADKTASLQVYVVDVATGRLDRRTPEGPSRFSLAWSPDGRWLAYSTGVFAPTSTIPATVELLDMQSSPARAPVEVLREATPVLRDLRWTPDGTMLLAQDRGRRTFVRRIAPDAAGGAPRVDSVSHALPRRAFRGWLPDGDGLGLLATVPAGMSSRLARVAFPSGEITVLSGPDTLARAVGSASPRGDDGRPPAHTVVAFTMEGGAMPSDVWVARWPRDAADGARALANRRNLTRAAEALPDAFRPTMRVMRWVSGDTVRRDTLEAQWLEPRGARPRAGWPVVVVPYGGYGNEFPRNDYFLDRGLLPLVAAGYVVVRPNTRGINTDGRDDGEYGRPQLQDTERLLDTMTAQGLVDPRRVAVIGHSHGGAMAYYYLTHATPRRDGGARFCAVVAVNGRADWVLQGNRGDGVLPDGLGGTPAELPARYRAFSPVANARAARAPLLAVAGAQDTQILPANVPAMATAMRRAGRRVETLVFPDEGHLLLTPANVRRFWARAFATVRAGCTARR
jgi:dipeptidyl aminopeptidase/acylaminoacyl peptidase